LLKLELFKIFSKWRTYIGFIAIGVLVPIIHIAMLAEGDTLIDASTRVLKESFDFKGELVNGYMVARIIMQFLFIQVPLLITLVGGDMLAGEATSGTYRLVLVRPISRLQLISAKYLAGSIYVFLMVLWLFILGLGLGVLLFGTGDMIVVRYIISILPVEDVFWRYQLAFLYSILSMQVVYTISFFFSSFVENSIGPIITTMAILIVLNILNLINIGSFSFLQGLLFTTHMNAWILLFEKTIDFPTLINSTLILVLHIVVLTGATFIYFNKKDIKS
jgi:ABC-2 type transport system permease protein